MSIEYHNKTALQIFARDITERKQLEEQLRQSQKIEAVGRLAGGIAHDFNNLMTVITGYVGLTKKRIGKPELVSKGLEEIEKASDRATRLTKQLIAFSRKQILQPQMLDVNLIVSNMEKMLRRLIGENIDLVTFPGSNLGKVKADPGQIEQVIVNLALNARDAMPQGGRITIETGNVDVGESASSKSPGSPAVPCVKLLFSDNGTGMEEEIKAHIFEPYFTTKEVGKGVGLGLATVYGIIRQSGGDYPGRERAGKGLHIHDIASPRGRGGTFHRTSGTGPGRRSRRRNNLGRRRRETSPEPYSRNLGGCGIQGLYGFQRGSGSCPALPEQ